MPLRLKSVGVFAAGLHRFMSVNVAPLSPQVVPPDLPKDLQTVVEAKYSGAKTVNLADLTEDDRQLFQNGQSRPGEG